MTRIQKQNHDPDLKKDANSTEDISDFNKNGHHDKIDLYLSLFRGRDDVYARRWVSRKTGRTGYSPALQDHAFENGRPKEVLSPDDYRPFTKVDFIENHLQGDRAIGVYPLLNDNTTWFLAFEFDGERAFMEAEELQGVCEMQSIPAYLEKSRSGNFHVWIFFTTPIPAWKARRVGLELLKEAGVVGEERQSERQAFDRMFPNQDRLSGKGFGNLIALPLHGPCVLDGRTEFLDPENDFQPYENQWIFLRTIRRIDEDSLLAIPIMEDVNNLREPPVPRTIRPLSPQGRSLQAILARSDTENEDALHRLESGCTFIQHCRDDAMTLPEKDWWGLASNLAPFGEPGRRRFHEYSKDYPSYDPTETDAKFDHQANDPKPVTCAFIREQIWDCRRDCGVRSPCALPFMRNEPKLPTIQTNGHQLKSLINKAWAAIHRANDPPSFFTRGGAMVRLIPGSVGLMTSLVNEAAAYGQLARVARWVSVYEDKEVAARPVRAVARDMITFPDPELPRLDAVVSTPVFVPDGTLSAAPGYHPGSGIWYEPVDSFVLPPVPADPGPEDSARARALLLNDLLVDFPFARTSDQAHAVAAIILPFVRQMISGPTPLHLIESPIPGSGKTLLAHVISMLTQGRVADTHTMGRDEQESRKKITAVLMGCTTIVLLDNFNEGVRSSNLAAAITAERWSDRVLGGSRTVNLPNQAMWIATANNPTVPLEVARRCLRISLEPEVDRPWLRIGFKHPTLLPWVQENRGRLVHALLTLVKAWINQGRPDGNRDLGSFESWSRVLGGILEAAGISGFLQDLDGLYEDADEESQEWIEFITEWWQRYQDRMVGVAELLPLTEQGDLLRTVVGDGSERSRRIRLGKALHRIRNRRFGPLQIKITRDRHTKSARYWVIHTSTKGGKAPPSVSVRDV